MVDTRVWGAAGILLALAGAAIIVPELLHSIAEGHTYVVAYGIAAIVAAVVTLLVVGRGVVART